MALTIGIVGLPNVGKSTLFNALTKNNVLAANYPFATIEPNTGVVEVPDARLPILAKIFGSERILPATVTFVDIAGIVRGASEGEGLGNKFLANIREADAIAQVVRGFVDGDAGRRRGLGGVFRFGVAGKQSQQQRCCQQRTGGASERGHRGRAPKRNRGWQSGAVWPRAGGLCRRLCPAKGIAAL